MKDIPMTQKTKIIILAIILGLPVCTYAQQLSQRTQFDINKMAYNPAVAGSEIKIPIVLNTRKQWIGFNQAPSSQTFSAHGFVGKGMGVGLVLNNDVAGPFRNSGLSLSAARHFKIAQSSRKETTWLSFGMGGLLYKYLIDQTKLTTTQQSDPAISKLVDDNGRLTFDLSFGLMLTHKNLYVGFSSFNMIENKKNLYTNTYNNNNLKRMYYLTAGYKKSLNEKVVLEPALLVKYTESGVFQPDILVKIHYGVVYGGLVLRPGDAIAGLFGLEFDQFFAVFYSYDYTVNDLNVYSNGSHEISLGIKIFEAISRDGPVTQEKNKIFKQQNRSKKPVWN